DRGDQQRLPPALRGRTRDRGRALRGPRGRGTDARGRGARLMRNAIVNADDFGASAGTNRGIVECHARGVLTSTSMMVTGAAVDEAVELSRAHPDLAIGLHWDVIGEDEREFDLSDHEAVRDEF